MTVAQPLEKSSARRVADRMADEHTPFIRNCWYVACYSSDVPADKPVGRVILGSPVVLYRGSDGSVTAMKDRCPHRSFPLSQGHVDGDEIVCGYHGMRYGSDGRCTAVPTMQRPAGAVRVPTFLVREQAPLVWIWMGDAALGAETPTPAEHWMLDSSDWASSCGYLQVASNYVFLHENLLDLSHLTFLHANTFGTPDYALAPYQTEIEPDVIRVRRTVQPTRLPPIYADPLDMQDVDAARIVTSTYVSPGLSISAVVLRNLSLPEEDRVDHHIRTAQLVTPLDRDNVHYHFVVARDFATGDANVSDFILAAIRAAFAEDVFALEQMTRIRSIDADPDFVEISLPSDRAGVVLRRRLLERATAQAEAPVA